jgi:hypothetical protein
MTATATFDLWLKENFQPQVIKERPEITLMWEVLPSQSGQPHAVDPDPDAMYENYPVSLCGTVLIPKDGKIEDGARVCETCIAISQERQREFDARDEA